MVFKMSDSVPSARYSSVCNVLRQWPGASRSSLLIESTDSIRGVANTKKVGGVGKQLDISICPVN